MVIYGIPPAGSGTAVVSPSQQIATSGNSATFTYSGAAFPNNLTVEAWIYDPAAGIPTGEPGADNGGYAIGVTQIVGQPTTMLLSDPSGRCDQQLYDCSILDAARSFQAASGDWLCRFTDSRTKCVFHLYGRYRVDGHAAANNRFAVDSPNPGRDRRADQPGPAGTQYYDSSGLTFSGYYYLAPVTFRLPPEPHRPFQLRCWP